MIGATAANANGQQKAEISLDSLSDAPAIYRTSNEAGESQSYQDVIKKWGSYLEVNLWISSNFRYSISRAKELGENSQVRDKTPILTPAELFAKKSGVCIDLSRFGVETLNSIDSSYRAKYLMLDFEPIEVEGRILRKHWLAVFSKGGNLYVFADSKTPGKLWGPYRDLSVFVSAYQQFRSRKINDWKLLPSYQKKRLSKSVRSIQGG